MKKLTFFVALIVSLNASVVVRKPEEEDISTTVVKDYSMAQKQTYSIWLQSFIQKLTISFYGITKTGEIHVFSWEKIQKIIKKKKTKTLEKMNKNWLLYRHYEEGYFE
ncbi:MAG: hypothetical protein DRJ10_06110 [Bacteroidetes bacterium]|nr:MAG: hypothetical protein DRJ10_06110 [Bacteroidota bacterium]RLD86637.1 MAG: hypothetical protein DRJ07_00315 [Bacteroidota bacterium]